MGLFDFVGNAGQKLFGASRIDENKVQEHLLGLGLKVRSLAVIAHQDEKMISLAGIAETLEDKEKLIIAAGNVEGIEKVDDRIRLVSAEQSVRDQPVADAEETLDSEVPEEEAPQSDFYTVVAGDTLSGIAGKFYGKAGLYPRIFEANRPMLTDPNKIYPGQVLRIPKSG